MTSEDEQWRFEVKWMSGNGVEHVIRGTARYHDEARGFVAVAIDELAELDLLLNDGEPAPPPPPSALASGQPVESLRDLWHWSITWSAPPSTVTHTAQSWALTGDQLWNEAISSIEELLDLREVLRMTRRQGPRPLGGDTFDEQLAEYDRRDEIRGRRFDT